MDDSRISTNPAVRLRDIVTSLAAVPHVQGNTTLNVMQAWCRAFTIPTDNTDKAMLAVIETMRVTKDLFDEVLGILGQIDGLEDGLFLKPVRTLREASLYPASMFEAWSSHTHRFNRDNLVSLNFVANEVTRAKRFEEPQLTGDELSELSAASDELYDTILSSNLPERAKRIFLDIVETLRRAVHEYRVRGNKGLREALTASTAIVINNQETVAEVKDTDELKAVATLMQRMETAAKVVNYGVSIYEVATKMLPLLGPGPASN